MLINIIPGTYQIAMNRAQHG